MKISFIINSDFYVQKTIEVENDVSFMTIKSLYWDDARNSGSLPQCFYLPYMTTEQGDEIDESAPLSKYHLENGGKIFIKLLESPI